MFQSSSKQSGNRRLAFVLTSIAVLFVSLLLIAAPLAQAKNSTHAKDGKDVLVIQILSSRPDMVTGGDALVRIDASDDVDLKKIVVELNGADVTSTFLPNPALHTLTGLVSGLNVGSNRLEATTKLRGGGSGGKGNAHDSARITLTNYPITGPVFSGPQEQPFICETQSFYLPVVGGTLGPVLDENCSIATRVDYFYRTATGFSPWPAGATTYPADLVMTTTTTGSNVPYIVRMETGTVNRSIYQTTILHDPLSEPTPNWHQRPAGWNGRLIYTFGGGCINGWYRQGRSTGGVTDNFMLSNGYAVASASLNVFGNNCQEITAAETMMMVKERFIKVYGLPTHTQGFGCSGGAYQQHQIGDNYPGLLDGIIPGCSFPEVSFATIIFITDAWLIDNYFKFLAPPFTDEQKRAVTGFVNYNTAPNVAVGARRIDPRVFCDGTLPVALRYDPVTNPTGARCDVYDHTINAFGADPITGFARRPLDNVGVQYGLRALNQGIISKAQFLDLNEKIGGFDNDANLVPLRTEGDPVAIKAAYRTGRLTNGGLGLHAIPIIEYRAYNDDVPQGDVHLRYHTFSMRARLDKETGSHANHIALHEDNRYGLYSTESPLLRFAILAMDRWITAIKADAAPGSAFEKVIRNKPADLQEGCMSRDASPTFIAENMTRDPAETCEQLYNSASFPREVAGSSVAADVIKCALTPLNPYDYAVTFTSDEWQRLRAIFPKGVCDWDKDGLFQRPPTGTWLSYDGGKRTRTH
jgi:hypothetical protein